MLKVIAYWLAVTFWSISMWTLYKFEHGPVSKVLWVLALGVLFFIYKYIEHWVLLAYRALLFRLASRDRINRWLEKNKPTFSNVYGIYGKNGYYENLTLEIYEFIVGLGAAAVLLLGCMLFSAEANAFFRVISELVAIVLMLLAILSSGLVVLSYQLWRYYPTQEELESIRANSKIRKLLRLK